MYIVWEHNISEYNAHLLSMSQQLTYHLYKLSNTNPSVEGAHAARVQTKLYDVNLTKNIIHLNVKCVM